MNEKVKFPFGAIPIPSLSRNLYFQDLGPLQVLYIFPNLYVDSSLSLSLSLAVFEYKREWWMKLKMKR